MIHVHVHLLSPKVGLVCLCVVSSIVQTADFTAQRRQCWFAVAYIGNANQNRLTQTILRTVLSWQQLTALQ